MDGGKGVKRQIIALCGLEGSGKNTAADLLVKRGFLAVSFAHTLKKACAVIFGWEFEMLEGITAASRAWREQVDEFWSTELGIPGLTPRRVLQLVGTNALRDHFSNKIWVASLKRQLINDITAMGGVGHDIVITDCRFPSEALAIKDWGGMMVNVTRQATLPKWWEDYWILKKEVEHPDQNRVFTNEELCTEVARVVYEEPGVHPAETSLLPYDGFDCQIQNDGTLEELEFALNKMLMLREPHKWIQNIAVDFDDVIVPFFPSFIAFCNRAYGYNLKIGDCVEMRFEVLLSCSYERAREIFDAFVVSEEHTLMHQIAPSEECKRVLSGLTKHFGLYVVTARQARFEAVTREYLGKHLPGMFAVAIPTARATDTPKPNYARK